MSDGYEMEIGEIYRRLLALEQKTVPPAEQKPAEWWILPNDRAVPITQFSRNLGVLDGAIRVREV